MPGKNKTAAPVNRAAVLLPGDNTLIGSVTGGQQG